MEILNLVLFGAVFYLALIGIPTLSGYWCRASEVQNTVLQNRVFSLCLTFPYLHGDFECTIHLYRPEKHLLPDGYRSMYASSKCKPLMEFQTNKNAANS